MKGTDKISIAIYRSTIQQKADYRQINTFNDAKDIWSDLKTFGVQLTEGNLNKMLLVAKAFYSKADADPKMKDDMGIDIQRLNATIKQTNDFLDEVKPTTRFGKAKFAMADVLEARRLNTILKEQQRDLMMKIDVLDQYERHVPPELLLDQRFTRHHASGYKVNSFLSVATGDYTNDLMGGPPYVEKSVLIETADVDAEGSKDTVKEIAGLLHRKLRDKGALQSNVFLKNGILPILGYRLKPAPELIFEMPAGFDLPANVDTRPKSLREVIIADKGTVTNYPLDFRFRLARKLCEAALRVHVVQLVHKNIRPETIFLFQPAITGTGDDAEAAREAAGFGDVYLTNWRLLRDAAGRSKKNPGPNDWAERFYRHPERQGLQIEDRYNLGHDVYSLGVCLLEIGLWDSFVLNTASARPGGAVILSLSARFVAAAREVVPGDEAGGAAAQGNEEAGGHITNPTPHPVPATIPPSLTTPLQSPAVPDPEQERLLAQRRMLQPDNIKEVLLHLAREQLPARMGLGYKKLVVACLTALDTPGGFGPDVNFKKGSRQDQVLDFVTLVQSYFQDLSKLKD